MQKRDKITIRLIVFNLLVAVLLLLQIQSTVSSQESLDQPLLEIGKKISGGAGGGGGQEILSPTGYLVGGGVMRMQSQERINRDKIIRESGPNKLIVFRSLKILL